MRLKIGLAEMLKGGVIMDVTNAEQAKIAEEAGAVAVMALERVPADIRARRRRRPHGQPAMIKEIQDTVSIPVMAKCRIGHFAEAQILEALGVDFIDESEVLTPADEKYHVDKHAFKVPFVCGCRNLGEALRRIGEGAAMIRTKGEAGSGNIVEAVRHMRPVQEGIRRLTVLRDDELMAEAKDLGAPYDLVLEVAPARQAAGAELRRRRHRHPGRRRLMMQLGAETVFVGSGIFKSKDPKPRAEAIVQAVTFYEDPQKLLEISMDLGEADERASTSRPCPRTRRWPAAAGSRDHAVRVSPVWRLPGRALLAGSCRTSRMSGTVGTIESNRSTHDRAARRHPGSAGRFRTPRAGAGPPGRGVRLRASAEELAACRGLSSRAARARR